MRTEDSDVTRHLLSNPVNAAALLRAIADLNAGLGFKHDPRHAPLGSPEGEVGSAPYPLHPLIGLPCGGSLIFIACGLASCPIYRGLPDRGSVVTPWYRTVLREAR
jgi:hypothetical protein